MAFQTSHTESGEGARGLKPALERSLDWLKHAEPGNAPVRWRLTLSFKETTEEDAAENEGMRRTGQLFEMEKRGPGRPRKNALPAPEAEPEPEPPDTGEAGA